MASPIWTSTSSTTYSTNGNWTPATAPVDGDTVTINGQGTANIAGEDASAIEPAALNVYMSYLGTIGSSVTALQIGPAKCDIGLMPDDGSSPAGPSLVNLNFTSDQTACTVHNARSTGTNGFPCVVLTGTNASNTLLVKGGSVGVGVFTPGVATTFSTITVNGTTANVIIGTNVTCTTLLVGAGAVLQQSSVTTLDHQGGTIETRGTGTITTAYCGGTKATLSSTGTITTLNVLGNCETVLSGSGQSARTITACVLSGPNCKLDLRNTGTAITFTNGIQLTDGASASQVYTDDSITLTLATGSSPAYVVIEAHTANDTLTAAESGSTHTNLGASGTITLSLPQSVPAGAFFKFNCMAAQALRIDPGAAGAIYINGAKQNDDKYIEFDDEAEHVTLTADGNGDWIAGPYNGTFTVEP